MSTGPILGEQKTTLELSYVWNDKGVYLRHPAGVELFPSKKLAISRVQDLVIAAVALQVNVLRSLLEPSPAEMEIRETSFRLVTPPELSWQPVILEIKTDVCNKSGRMEVEWGLKVAERVQQIRGRQPYGTIKATVANLVQGEMRRQIKR